MPPTDCNPDPSIQFCQNLQNHQQLKSSSPNAAAGQNSHKSGFWQHRSDRNLEKREIVASVLASWLSVGLDIGYDELVSSGWFFV